MLYFLVFLASARLMLVVCQSNTGSVTTLVGTAGSVGTADGVGAAAQFNSPRGIALDSTGTVALVVCVYEDRRLHGTSSTDFLPRARVQVDYWNHVVRRVAVSSATVTTLAGLPGNPGSVDGVGTTARFSNPVGVSVDSARTFAVVVGSAVRAAHLSVSCV